MSYLRYTNQGAIRNRPLHPDLVDALRFLEDMNLVAEVYSGGQAPLGSGGPRTGSTRHDNGLAADVQFRHPELGLLAHTNPEHLPILQEIVARARAAGLTGIGMGEGYMGPHGMHLGYGAETVWGAGGRRANAPDWLVESFYGAEPGPVRSPGGGVTRMAGLGGYDSGFGGYDSGFGGYNPYTAPLRMAVQQSGDDYFAINKQGEQLAIPRGFMRIGNHAYNMPKISEGLGALSRILA